MKPYRLKHKPTGLYYTPIKGRFEYQSNLSKNGTVYLNKSNALIGVGDTMWISISVKQYENMKDLFDKLGAKKPTWEHVYIMRAKKTDFEIEFLDITE